MGSRAQMCAGYLLSFIMRKALFQTRNAEWYTLPFVFYVSVSVSRTILKWYSLILWYKELHSYIWICILISFTLSNQVYFTLKQLLLCVNGLLRAIVFAILWLERQRILNADISEIYFIFLDKWILNESGKRYRVNWFI